MSAGLVPARDDLGGQLDAPRLVDDAVGDEVLGHGCPLIVLRRLMVLGLDGRALGHRFAAVGRAGLVRRRLAVGAVGSRAAERRAAGRMPRSGSRLPSAVGGFTGAAGAGVTRLLPGGVTSWRMAT